MDAGGRRLQTWLKVVEMGRKWMKISAVQEASAMPVFQIYSFGNYDSYVCQVHHQNKTTDI